MKRRFRFSLERVLGVRRLEERMRQAEFAAAQAQFLAAEESLEKSRKDLSQGTDDLGSLRKISPLPLTECLRVEELLKDFQKAIVRKTSLREARRQALENARATLTAASARRKALDRLRETRRLEHQKEMASAESKLFDEIASGRALRRAEETIEEDA